MCCSRDYLHSSAQLILPIPQSATPHNQPSRPKGEEWRKGRDINVNFDGQITLIQCVTALFFVVLFSTGLAHAVCVLHVLLEQDFGMRRGTNLCPI